MNPFAVLAFPGIYIAYKINEFKKQCQEKSKEKTTERELALLHQKIDRLMTKLENARLEVATCREEECVICISSKATMQTFPCGHRVVCQKCFMKTVHAAVSQRRLPLRCVFCRAQVLRLKNIGQNPCVPRPAWQPLSSGYPAIQRKSQHSEKGEHKGFIVGSMLHQSSKAPCVLHKHKPKQTFPYTRMEEVNFVADDAKRSTTIYASGHVPHRHRRGRRKRHRRHGGHISPALFPISEKEELELAEVSNLGRSPVRANEERKETPKISSEQRLHLEKNSRKKSLSVFGSFHITLMNRSPLKVFKEKYHHLM